MRFATLGTALCIVLTVTSTAQDKPLPPAHTMEDGFRYAVLNYGVGLVPADFGRKESVFWIKLRITNLSARQLGSPRHPSMYTAIDDAKNVYTVRHARAQRVEALLSRRYKPGESSIQLLTIDASEMIDGIKDLKVMLGDNKSLGRSIKFFQFRNPQSRRRDFDPEANDPDPFDLGVEARSAFLSPIPEH
jgi:hypothetical protein